MRGALSSWSDRGARVACLGFAVASLHAGHGSLATRKATAPTRASEAVFHLALQVGISVFARAPHGRQAVDGRAAPAGGDCNRQSCFLVSKGLLQSAIVLISGGNGEFRFLVISEPWRSTPRRMESFVNMVPGMFPVCVSRSSRWRSPSTPSSKEAGNLLHRHQVRQQPGQDDGGAPRAGDLSPGEGMMEELHGQKNQSMVDMNNIVVPEERSRVLGAEQRRRALGEEHRGAGRWKRTQRRWALSSWAWAVGAGS